MGDNSYNTDHGSFLLREKNNGHALKALNALLKEHDPDTHERDDMGHALASFGLECSYAHGTENCNDMVDLFLAGDGFGDNEWAACKAIAPFVEDGSFVVFYGGGTGGCYALVWEKNKDTDKVEFFESDLTTVLDHDLKEMLAALKDTPLGKKMIAKYAGAEWFKEPKSDGPG